MPLSGIQNCFYFGFHQSEGIIRIYFDIPDRLIQPLVRLALLYRRICFGYTFRRIPLTQGKHAIVDPEDYQRLNKHKWHVVRGTNTYYACRNSRIGNKRISIKMHRQILKPQWPMIADHINGKGYDNRKANLRLATRSQNCMNKPFIKTKTSSSKYRGVSWSKSLKKWHVQIGLHGKHIYIGYFDDETDAAKAYDKAAKKHHGEFAVTNFKE